jgi:hypothetical protein
MRRCAGLICNWYDTVSMNPDLAPPSFGHWFCKPFRINPPCRRAAICSIVLLSSLSCSRHCFALFSVAPYCITIPNNCKVLHKVCDQWEQAEADRAAARIGWRPGRPAARGRFVTDEPADSAAFRAAAGPAGWRTRIVEIRHPGRPQPPVIGVERLLLKCLTNGATRSPPGMPLS